MVYRQEYLDYVVAEVSEGAYRSHREPAVALFQQLCRFYGSEHVLLVRQLEFQYLAHYAVRLADNDGSSYPSVRDAIRDAAVYAVGELERLVGELSEERPLLTNQEQKPTLKIVSDQ